MVVTLLVKLEHLLGASYAKITELDRTCFTVPAAWNVSCHYDVDAFDGTAKLELQSCLFLHVFCVCCCHPSYIMTYSSEILMEHAKVYSRLFKIS